MLNPPSYGGSLDTEVFKHWLNALLQWLNVSKVSGPSLDTERIEYTGMYLEGIALAQWNFKDVITGLYDWFIHDNTTHDAADHFSKMNVTTWTSSVLDATSRSVTPHARHI